MKSKKTILEEIIDLSTWFHENNMENIDSIGKYQIYPEYFEILKEESNNNELFKNVVIYNERIDFTAKENGKNYQITADMENNL